MSTPILEFVLRNYKNFNSRATRDALIAYWKHVDGGGRMFWAMAGAMSRDDHARAAIREGLVRSFRDWAIWKSPVRLVAHDSYRTSWCVTSQNRTTRILKTGCADTTTFPKTKRSAPSKNSSCQCETRRRRRRSAR
jgi:hypothetical protein